MTLFRTPSSSSSFSSASNFSSYSSSLTSMTLLLLVALNPSSSSSSSVAEAFVPTILNVHHRRHYCHRNLILHELASTPDATHGDEEDQAIALEPTVLVNGQDLCTDETTSSLMAPKDDIFGATAAMAVAVDTPLETTLQNIQHAGLMDLALINAQGDRYETPDALAPFVQGHRVALYFGAGWCPACRDLEFMLPQYMKALCESEQKIRLIYVSSDTSLEFQLDRMTKLGLEVGVSFGKTTQALKEKYGIWSGMEAKDFTECTTTRRSGVPAFVVLDTEGGELKYLNTEADTIAAMADWDLDDPKGVF